MPFSEFELRRYGKAVAAYVETRRPEPHIRNELDIGFRIEGQSVEIFTIRPAWDNPREIIESSVAKTTYVKKSDDWKIYWQRADLKWHRYDPDPTTESIEEALRIIETDKLGCFWG